VTDAQAGALRVIVVMGVEGAGKTTVGEALAQALGWHYYDADQYHSPENIEKMHRGEPLTDDDRRPWLAALRALVARVIKENGRGVLACSALKQWYREAIVPPGAPPGSVRFVYLDVPVDVLRERVAKRTGHFAPPALLDSQLATLEKPREAVWVDGARDVADIVQSTREALGV
jgi:gluconokinase